MSEKIYTAKLRGEELSATSHDLRAFQATYVKSPDLGARMSSLFLFDVYVLDAAFGVSPDAIFRAVNDVELGEPLSGVKAATQFKHMPLKGLWHKHYFSAHFLLENIAQGLGSTGAMKIVMDVVDPAKSPVVTSDMIKEVARRITQDPFADRDNRKRLTGEWIIYIRHNEVNYYLCCGSHIDGDNFLYTKIMEHCLQDFPDLPLWLREVK